MSHHLIILSPKQLSHLTYVRNKTRKVKMEKSGQTFAKQYSLKYLLENWKEMSAKQPDRGNGNEESNCIQRKGKE